MKRVVVTGIGIVSSLGNNCREVLESLKNLKSDISFDSFDLCWFKACFIRD